MTRRRGAGPWWHYLGVTVVCVLGGCGLLADEPPSVVAQSEPEVVMSGGYAVGEDGKLEKPAKSVISKPRFPDAARALDSKGAEEFAHYFVHLLEYVWDSGDIEDFTVACAPECEFCIKVKASINNLYESGRWVEGMKYYVLHTEPAVIVSPPTVPREAHVIVMTAQTTRKELYDDGAVLPIDSRIETVEVHMVVIDGEWKVDNVYAFENE